MASERSKGTVKWFNDTKGFGFITPENGGGDLFVHQSFIRSGGGFRSLSDGQSVEFQITCGVDGRSQAADVTGPNETPVAGKPNSGENSGGGRGGGGFYNPTP